MVAQRFASGRAVAVAIVAILTFSILPSSEAQLPVPTPDPTVPSRNFGLVQGEAYFYQDGGPTSFIKNGSSFSLRVRVTLNGDGDVNNVPIFWWLNDQTTKAGCTVVDFDDREDEKEVTVSLGPADNVGFGGHNVTVAVLFDTSPAGPSPGWDFPGSVDLCGDNRHLPFTAGNAPQCADDTTLCSNDAFPDNNRIRAYFVKDRYLDLRPITFQWCEGDGSFTNLTGADCDDRMINDSSNLPYNVTPHNCGDGQGNANECFTHFRLIVDNKGSWPYRLDYGSALNDADVVGWTYELNVSVNHTNLTTTYLTRTVHMTEETVPDFPSRHVARSANWSLVNTWGVYNITLRIDPQRSTHRANNDTSIDAAWARAPFWTKPANNLSVFHREFTGNFTASQLKTSQSDPYPYTTGFIIGGNVQVNNTGNIATPSGSPIAVTIYLDNLTWTDSDGVVHKNTVFIKEYKSGTPNPPLDLLAGGKQVLDFSWEATSTLGNGRYITPGEHTIYMVVDNGTAVPEANESNNNISIKIYVRDATKPRVTNTKTVLDLPGASPDSDDVVTFRPKEGFRIYTNIQDDDSAVRVHANFTLNSNTSVYRHVNLTRVETSPTTFREFIGDFMFHNFTNVTFNGTENWTMVVVANDSFGNLGNSTPKPFKLKGWPIHNASGDFVIEIPGTYPHDEIAWGSEENPVFNIRVLPNATGYTQGSLANQQNYTANLGYNVTTLKKTHAFFGEGVFTNKTDMLTCGPGAGDDLPDLPPGVPAPPSPVCDETTNNTFEVIFPKDQDDGSAGPGLWNYSILIKDIAGYIRAINGTLLINDTAPEILSSNLSANNVTPGQEVRVRANITDDAHDVAEAHVVFNRATASGNVTMNLTLTTFNETGGGRYVEFNQSFPTGRYQQLGSGGTFNVSIQAVDGTGNWNTSHLGNFTIKDDEPPLLTGYGVIPPAAEVGENVTFWANVSDATNSTVEIRIFRGLGTSELLTSEPIVLNQTASSNYTYTMNFTDENVYAWTITPIDSLARVGGAGSGTISVRDNLGPRYDVRGPSALIDGVRYGAGTPRIEVIVQDVEGVLASSVDMTVAGLPVDFDLLPAPGSINGYLVSYAVPTAKKFNHNDVVEVNLTAKDDSVEALESTFSFNFTVDDVAPTTRLISISPSYRDQPAHVLNVSLNSKFTLAAEDVDGLPTQVAEGGIRYRILGGGPGAAETIYGGPFKINDASGVYTGPRLYQVQFWAEDAVGNFNRNPNVTTVFVDDTPPALFQFFPQGREINATFVDDRVGVDRGVVWYRVNEQPYVPLPLVEREGAWTITLPEAVKTDRICYYLQAWDRLDNTETFGNQTAPYACFDVSNHEPRIRIRTPADGSTVSRSFELTWEASDEDGDAMVFTVYVRRPGQQNFAELTRIENTEARRYVVDSARYPDGQYTFRVAAGDGGFVKLSETTVSILNKADPVGRVTVTGDALPGTSMLVTAEITKAEAIVEARLYLGEDLVGSYPMNDEGNNGDVTAGDGTYSTLVPVTAAGDYRVEIYTSYREDGQTKESSVTNAATFSAKLTPGYILSEYAAIIALIGLLAAVGIGVGVFVVMRRR